MYHINNGTINKCQVQKIHFAHDDMYNLTYHDTTITIPSTSLYNFYVKKSKKAARKSIQRSIIRKHNIYKGMQSHLEDLNSIINAYWAED